MDLVFGKSVPRLAARASERQNYSSLLANTVQPDLSKDEEDMEVDESSNVHHDPIIPAYLQMNFIPNSIPMENLGILMHQIQMIGTGQSLQDFNFDDDVFLLHKIECNGKVNLGKKTTIVRFPST